MTDMVGGWLCALIFTTPYFLRAFGHSREYARALDSMQSEEALPMQQHMQAEWRATQMAEAPSPGASAASGSGSMGMSRNAG
jgi:hypothetical protein